MNLRPLLALSLAVTVLLPAPAGAADDDVRGYYRKPTLRGDTVVFVAEGDLWSTTVEGGTARRLTSHLEGESRPALSPDGSRIAFSASYEGPMEVYSMPVAGGLPTRHTWDGDRAYVAGWTRDGRILYATRRFATLPDFQSVMVDPVTGASERLPLQPCWNGTWDEGGRLFFTRLAPQSSQTRRYKGGTAQNLWRWDGGDGEAVPLTADYPGTSRDPEWDGGRVWFLTDRDGTTNIWSMNGDGGDLRQHTRFTDLEVREMSVDGGRAVYRRGADLHLLDLATGEDRRIDIRLSSDLDQRREKWVDKPQAYLTSAAPSPDGERAALVSRGRVFVAPRRAGRLVQVTADTTVRYSNARFMPDGKSLLAQTDASGELEWCLLPADGVGEPRPLTTDGDIFRFEGSISPDGKRLAYGDKNLALWVRELEGGPPTRIHVSGEDEIRGLAWSPDSKWLAFTSTAPNFSYRVFVWGVDDGKVTAVTSDRCDSYSAAWSADGKWLYFLSDRNLKSLVRSPWGARQPDPYFEDTTKIYALGLVKGERFPFLPPDEIWEAEEKARKEKEEQERKDKAKEKGESKETPALPVAKPDAEDGKREGADNSGKGKDSKAPPAVVIDFSGLENRLWEVPLPPGDYSDLYVSKDRLWFRSRVVRPTSRTDLCWAPVTWDDPKVSTLLENVASCEPSADGSRILVRRGGDVLLVDARAKGPEAAKDADLDLKGWSFPVTPADEWRQMYLEAWRLQRDFFYDPKMHGVDWPAMRDRYLPLVARVTDREELSDVIAQMLSEISALHTFVYGGDVRDGRESITVATLGAQLDPVPESGGWRISRIYRHEPDDPASRSPLSRPDLEINEGDVILAINGNSLASPGAQPGTLLRNQAGRQVLLTLRPVTGGEPVMKIVTALQPDADRDLRYTTWELERRDMVEKLGQGRFGYIHLRAMGTGDMADWVRQYYPVFDRDGLIIDVRHNGGGNIDSWILGKLLRKAWFYWKGRAGRPYWNMHYAFRGHMVVLVDERTGSDGEAFAEGFRRLGLGQVIGTRTWGGEIWLSSRDWLVDRGYATAAENGVFGPEGEWLIEGHGVDPDIVVENLPRATFDGKDAQLEAAVEHLRELDREAPSPVPEAPPHPDKSR